MLKRIGWILVFAAAAYAQSSGIEGIWQGTIEAGGVKLRVAFHISKDDKGALLTKWDSLDQGAMDLPVRQTSFAENKLHLQVNPTIIYDGILNATGDGIAGLRRRDRRIFHSW